MKAPKPWNAVRLQIRQWENDHKLAVTCRDQLALQIDEHPGPPGPELNKLVESFIVWQGQAEDLERKLDRVRDQREPITSA